MFTKTLRALAHSIRQTEYFMINMIKTKVNDDDLFFYKTVIFSMMAHGLFVLLIKGAA